MQPKRITYFDHDSDAREKSKIIFDSDARIKNKFQLKIIPHDRDNDAIEQLKDGEIIIAHMFTEEFSLLLDESGANSIRLRVSTKGLNELSYKSDKGVNCIFLRVKHDQLNAADWRVILETITNHEIVDKIVAGSISPDLQRYFGFRHKEIIALGFLCRGYLFSWAASKGLFNNRTDKIDNQINDILELIFFEHLPKNGLFEKSGSGNLKIPCAFESVKNIDYWKIFEAEVSKTVEDEMKAFDINPELFQNVQALAKQIDSKENGDIDDPLLVAKACREIKQQEALLGW